MSKDPKIEAEEVEADRRALQIASAGLESAALRVAEILAQMQAALAASKAAQAAIDKRTREAGGG